MQRVSAPAKRLRHNRSTGDPLRHPVSISPFRRDWCRRCACSPASRSKWKSRCCKRANRLVINEMIPPDALQILIITHARDAAAGDYPRPKDYVEAIRHSFTRPETNELVRELSLVDEQGTGASVRAFYVDGSD